MGRDGTWNEFQGDIRKDVTCPGSAGGLCVLRVAVAAGPKHGLFGVVSTLFYPLSPYARSSSVPREASIQVAGPLANGVCPGSLEHRYSRGRTHDFTRRSVRGRHDIW